jgi:hypothetical protein
LPGTLWAGGSRVRSTRPRADIIASSRYRDSGMVEPGSSSYKRGVNGRMTEGNGEMIVVYVVAGAALVAGTVRAAQSLHLLWKRTREGDLSSRRELTASLLLRLSLCGVMAGSLFAEWHRAYAAFAILGVAGVALLIATAMQRHRA